MLQKSFVAAGKLSGEKKEPNGFELLNKFTSGDGNLDTILIDIVFFGLDLFG